MVISQNTVQEFHPNGQLFYSETRAVVSALSAHLYDDTRINSDGSQWIRIGECVKYFDNGQLAWRLTYDNMGRIVKNDSKQFRKDGTVIIY